MDAGKSYMLQKGKLFVEGVSKEEHDAVFDGLVAIGHPGKSFASSPVTLGPKEVITVTITDEFVNYSPLSVQWANAFVQDGSPSVQLGVMYLYNEHSSTGNTLSVDVYNPTNSTLQITYISTGVIYFKSDYIGYVR